MSGLALVGGALGWIGVWKGWLPLAAALLIGLVLGALAGIGFWARWQGHMRMRPENGNLPLSVSAPLPDEHVRLRASGRFEVMHSRRDFVNAEAVFTTMDSGEHVIMAHIRRSRFLLLGQWPVGELGWWYIFLPPESLASVTSGQLVFGLRHRPALEVCRRSCEEVERRLYLSFDDLEQRARVWAGLGRL